jgi:PAS domain S-box-containing protein
MMADQNEDDLLRSVALQNAQAILAARQRAEQELIEAKQALEQKTDELARARELFQNVFDQAAVGIARIDAAGRWLMVNPGLCEMLGYTPEDLRAVPLPQLTHPDNVAADSEMMLRLLSGEARVCRRETRFLRNDGAIVWVHITCSVEREREIAAHKSFIAVIQDITERKKAEDERQKLLAREQTARRQAETANAQLRESEEKYRALFNSIDESFFVIEVLFDDTDYAVDFRCLEVNPAFEKQTGVSNVVGRRMREIEPAIEEHWYQIYGQVARTGESRRFENPALGRFFDVYAFRLGPPERRQVAVLFNEITERKRVESEQKFLSDLGVVLASTLDYEETLGNIARLAVRDLADFCIVDLVEDVGGTRRLKVLSRDPSKAWVCDLFMQVPLEAGDTPLVRSVLVNKQTALYQSPIETFTAAGYSVQSVGAFRAADSRSVIVAPLLAHDRLVGVIALVSSSASRAFEPPDVRLAEELARRAALSIHNARLFFEAQRAIKTREDVLAIVSHDLQNPLATIKLAVHLLLGFERMDAPRVKEFMNMVQRSADQMEILIADLLDFARIQSGTFSVEISAARLSPVLMPAIDRMRALAEAKRQTFEVDIPPGLPSVAIDARRIGQVVSNLVSNAIKFTPPEGAIRVSARQRDRQIVVSVKDTGPGIPKEHLSKIFERFWQTPGTREKGSGLGLSIAKGIVEAHGGRIWAESQPGNGSSFFFTVPLADLDTGESAGAA